MIILFILWWLIIVGTFVGGILIVCFDDFNPAAGIIFILFGGGLITLSIVALTGALDHYL